jgi:hypothetical protein
MKKSGETPPLSSEDADRVLARASELDALRRSAITEEQLRQAALDAGILPEAFDEALAEVRTRNPTVQISPPQRVGSLLFPILALGLGTGALSRLLRPFASLDGLHLEALGSVILVNATALFLVHQGTKHRRHGILQRDLIALFGGVLGGWSLLNGGAWEDMTFVTALNWLGAAIVGGAVLWWSSRQGEAVPASSTTSLADPEVRKDRTPGSNRLEVRRGIEIVPA